MLEYYGYPSDLRIKPGMAIQQYDFSLAKELHTGSDLVTHV